MDPSAHDAVLHVTEKVKEAEKGPVGRRVTTIEAQWWFCQEVSLNLGKQGAGNWRFQDAVAIPEPHRRTRKHATLYRLERASRFEHTDDIAAVLFAGRDVAALGAEPWDDTRIMRAAQGDGEGDDGAGAGALTQRELRWVLDGVVFPCIHQAIGCLERQPSGSWETWGDDKQAFPPHRQ